jgi:hypothetical protein
MTSTARLAVAIVMIAAAGAAGTSLSARQRNLLPWAQRASPHESHDFTVDGSKITIEYGRPFKRGRVVWGGLRPWGQWWMPGADEATTMITVDALVIGPLAVPAGQHTLYMMVDEKAPQLIVSKETGQFHTVYHPNQDLGRVDFQLKMLTEPVEQMTWMFEQQPGGGGVLKLIWDDREYFVPFVVKK